VSESWHLQAKCRDLDPDLAFARADSPEIKQFIGELCRRCPVAEECLSFALRIESRLRTGQSRFGVYGGLTGEERARLSRWGVRSCIECEKEFVPRNRVNVRCRRCAARAERRHELRSAA